MSAQESLLIVSQSADPYSILLLDPSSGSTRWGFRGTELQSGRIQTADFLGEEHSHLCVALADKPILTTIPVRKQRAGRDKATFCTRSILGQSASLLACHPSGQFVFVVSANRLHTWEVHSGQMLSLVEQHVREISALRLSSCGHFLATGSLDGAVKMFLTANLITPREEGGGRDQPIGGHSAHSLPVNELFISSGLGPRLLSVSEDHTAALFSLATRQILLKITSDRPLTACCMDWAETRLFLGAGNGRICAVDIQSEFASAYKPMTTRKSLQNGTLPSASAQHQQFELHESPVRKLAANSDGTRLASGAEDGSYAVWDCANGQCLRSGKMAGPIAALAFLPNCSLNREEEAEADGHAGPVVAPPVVASLQRQLAATERRMRAGKRLEGRMATGEEQMSLQTRLDDLLRQLNGRALGLAPENGPRVEKQQLPGKRRRLEDNQSQQTEGGNGPTGEAAEALKQCMAEMEAEMARVVAINAQIFNYAVGLAIDEETTTANGGGEA